MPIAASTGVADVLTDLFVVLLAAKRGDELFRRARQPTIVGEILAGVLVGPAVLGLVEPSEVLEVFAELGVVFLLFWVGLETRLSELREVGA
ncbi:MAG TPA: cation:proton antiporter, partial [Solirubrobacteraceae bacterium]|nr:cation:proton antiporter [Solirubrobacteraceae bacterium]